MRLGRSEVPESNGDAAPDHFRCLRWPAFVASTEIAAAAYPVLTRSNLKPRLKLIKYLFHWRTRHDSNV
jgi:hypothetical protein